MLSLMEPTSVATALEIVGKAWKALEAVRERAQTSKDADLKSRIGELYDDFLALRSIIVRLTDENSELRQGQIENPQISQVGSTNYYFVGEKGPYCQKCYDTQGKLVSLTAQAIYFHGRGRKCEVCGKVFIEGPKSQPRVPV